MARNWSRFSQKRNSRAPTAIQVSLQSRGAIYLNKAGFEALGEPKAVELLYDEETPAIGLQPADPDLPFAYPVRQSSNAKAYQIAFITFARYYNIDISETRRYQAKMEENILVIDLSQRSATSGRIAKNAGNAKRAVPQYESVARPEPLALVATGD